MSDIFYNEKGYLELLQNILNEGYYKSNRNGYTYSTFSKMIKFDIKNNFPLLTTKKTFFKGIVEELLWFISGSTNSKDLEKRGVNIWKFNSSREFLDNNGFNDFEEGELGFIYGYQWRNFNSEGIDQIKYVITELLKEDSRRPLLCAWNPAQLNKMVLPPCHLIYNFYKDNNGLSCLMYMRSTDVFLGLPFNIGTTALLTMIIAKVLHLEVNKIAVNMCDCHIYEEHKNNVLVQIDREPYDFPTLKINKDAPELNSSIDEKIKWIESLKYEDFLLENYNCHSVLKDIMK